MNLDASYRSLVETYNRAKNNPGIAPFESNQVRDLTVINFIGDILIVIAVDSDGAIGEKPSDIVKVNGYVCGRFGTRVPLMEILACGAIPIAAFDPLAVEMDPYGMAIIDGVRDELRSAGLSEDFPLSGSTEDNIPTVQTGMGVVIMGIVMKQDFRPGTSQPGDHVYCIGIPKSGPDDMITLDDPEIADARTIEEVRRIEGVHDILPVGSKGIMYESTQLSISAGLTFHNFQSKVDLLKSAGPSTCILISTTETAAKLIQKITERPVNRIGSLVLDNEKQQQYTLNRSGFL